MSVCSEASVPPGKWLTRFTFLTAATTLLLICIGGLVTSHEAGMAVPDWPNTYGYNMFFFHWSKWIGGIFYEHTHRLVASFVGLLTTILAMWLWGRETSGSKKWGGVGVFVFVILLMGVRRMPVYVTLASIAPLIIVLGFVKFNQNRKAFRWLGVVAFAAVILQGVLGGLRVVWLKDEIGIFHGALAQLFFVLTCAIAFTQTKWWRNLSSSSESEASNLRFIFLGITALVFVQLVLGATMRHEHAGLAISDFPKAHGKWWPDMSDTAVASYNQQRLETKGYNPITAFQIGLQMMHRIVAVVIFIAVFYVASLTKRRFRSTNPLSKISFIWAALVSVQVFLGAATIWTDKSADVATAHVAVGALILMTGAMLVIVAFRLLKPATQTDSAVAATAFATQSAVPSK